MSIKYDVYETPALSKKGEPVYCVKVKNTGVINSERLAREIAHFTSLAPGDVESVFTSLGYLFTQHLSEGKRLYLKGIGYFQLSIEAKNVDEPRQVRGNHVSVKTITYRPEKQLKAALSNVTFERTRDKVHSPLVSIEKIKQMLEEYFKDHAFITRLEFQLLCGFTRSTAINRINLLLKEGVLQRVGARNTSVYIAALTFLTSPNLSKGD